MEELDADTIYQIRLIDELSTFTQEMTLKDDEYNNIKCVPKSLSPATDIFPYPENFKKSLPLFSTSITTSEKSIFFTKQSDMDETHPIRLLALGDYKGFCGIIENDIKVLEPLLFSENVLTSAISKYLFGLNDYKVVGLDMKCEEEIEGKTSTFRCDVVFIHGTTLYIIENKYRSDRVRQHLDALVCIRFRHYVPRMLNFLEEKLPSYYILIKDVVSVGVALATNPINVTCAAEKTSVEDVDRTGYRTLNFVEMMKKGVKRFGKYCDN